MDLSQVKLAARDLFRNRTRSLISLSAIAFGVVALMMAGGFVEYTFFAIRENTIQNGSAHIQISRVGYRDAGFADPHAYLLPRGAPELELVRTAPGVDVVGERLNLTGLASNGELTIAFIGEAGDPQGESIFTSDFLPRVGQKLDAADPNGILMGGGLAALLGLKLGDKLSLIVSVPGGGINAIEAHVRGTFRTQIKAFDDSVIRMSIALGRRLLRVEGAHVWVVHLTKTEQTDEATRYLRQRLPADRFEVKSWFELSDFYRKTVTLLSRELNVVRALISVIIVLGISNTLTMSVLERTGEIGTILAFGTRRRRVLELFILQGLLLGVIGAVLGTGLGYALAQVLSHIGIPMPPPPGHDAGYSAEILVTPEVIFWGFVIAIIPSTLASLYPAWKAARLPIVDAIRHNR